MDALAVLQAGSWFRDFGLARLRGLLLGISAEEATFVRRGFLASDGGVRARLEESGRSFLY